MPLEILLGWQTYFFPSSPVNRTGGFAAGALCSYSIYSFAKTVQAEEFDLGRGVSSENKQFEFSRSIQAGVQQVAKVGAKSTDRSALTDL